MQKQDGRTIQKQKGITMNDSAFQIRRPRKKNILRIAAFSAGEIAAAVLFHFFYLPAPETQNKKLFAAVLFCAFLIFSLFATAFIADGFRNLFGKAAVIITAGSADFQKKFRFMQSKPWRLSTERKNFSSCLSAVRRQKYRTDYANCRYSRYGKQSGTGLTTFRKTNRKIQPDKNNHNRRKTRWRKPNGPNNSAGQSNPETTVFWSTRRRDPERLRFSAAESRR